jgi:6-pyruvoyltetrahydropterin/6-carboxytetrahydropterin synthase
MIEVTRVIEFDAAHRIEGHTGKCHNVHGHRYKVEATFQAKELNKLGMVEDFSFIKERLGGWIEENWDHGMILYAGDPIAVLWSKHLKGKLCHHKHYYMEDHPTAENMAQYLLNVICPQLFIDSGSSLRVTKIVVWETPNCKATATLES